MHALGLLELLVDLEQLRVVALAAAEARARSWRISASRSRVDRQPTIFIGSISQSAFGGSIPFTIGTFAVL